MVVEDCCFVESSPVWVGVTSNLAYPTNKHLRSVTDSSTQDQRPANPVKSTAPLNHNQHRLSDFPTSTRMGKGKPKTAAPTAISQEFSTPATTANGKGEHDIQPLADSVDLDGLTEEHLEEYTKLLLERARLEKEKEELEKKSARYQAERALLNEDSATFDRLFKLELGGEYRFSRDDLCCLDLADDHTPVQHSKGSRRGCQHEICARAKSKGVSWREMDTLRLYRTRITAEKSQRMKNALRKQRDGDLTRVKREDEEEGALRSRRSALTKKLSKMDSGLASLPENADALLKLTDPVLLEAAKENDEIVKNIRARLDKIRQDVYTGKLTAKDARIKLDQANQDMMDVEHNRGSSNASKSAAKRQDSRSTTSPFTLSHELASTFADTSTEPFPKALDVFKKFLSATDPGVVHSAITELRSIFELSGTMPPDIDRKLKDVKSLLDDPNTKRIKDEIARADGTKLEVENVVDMLILLRSPKDQDLLKSKAKDFELDEKNLRKNNVCIEIETKAYEDIVKKGRDPALMTQETFNMLEQIRVNAVKNSPIPAITDFVLEHKQELFLVNRAIRGLYAWNAEYLKVLRDGPTTKQLQTYPDIVQTAQQWDSSIEARLTHVVERLAGGVSEKKVRVLDRLEQEYARVARDSGYPIAKFSTALASIRQFIDRDCSPKSPSAKDSAANLKRLEELMTKDAPKSDVVRVAENVAALHTKAQQHEYISQIIKAKEARAAEVAAEMERSQSNLAQSPHTSTSGPSQSADTQPTGPKKKKRRSRKPKLKEVPVNTPRIEEGMARAGLHNELREEEDEDAALSKGKGKGKEKETASDDTAIMSPAELVWKRQITDMAVNLGKLMETSEVLEGVPDAVPSEFRGVTKMLQDQFKQHLENAVFLCGCKPEWVGLKAWLTAEHGQRFDDHDEE